MKRDVALFEAAYDAHCGLVFAIALRMLGEVARAEDLTEAVFVRYWKQPELFAGERDAAFGRVTRGMAIAAISEDAADTPFGQARAQVRAELAALHSRG